MNLNERAGYKRYKIDIKECPEIIKVPSKFKVRIKRIKLIFHIIKGVFEHRFNFKIALSRPCIYGVFSRVVGGLLPMEDKCVGCLRCNIQYPEIARVFPNKDRGKDMNKLMKAEQIDTILYEAKTGMVPVKGAGYRGEFGGENWDSMWTDMSEIVRPTRDGIYGREYISTTVDIGYKPKYFKLDSNQKINFISIELPFIFDILPDTNRSDLICEIFSKAAKELGTLAIIPFDKIKETNERANFIIPFFNSKFTNFEKANIEFPIIEIDYRNEKAIRFFQSKFTDTLICLRLPYENDLTNWYERGIRIFHLICDYNGRSNGKFAKDLILDVHKNLVDRKIREEITLIGGGGIIMAEHMAKAIICGLDLCSLDAALWAALQGKITNNKFTMNSIEIKFPRRIDLSWGAQRIKNLSNAWRDQLLEILGAMGLREVRRLRGELGRAIFQEELEKEAFGDIENFRS